MDAVTCDVVVVGFGCAGATAAIEAAESGADTLVLERASAAGGSSALSGGELYLGGGTEVQRACGVEDSAEDMLAFLEAALGPHADTEKLRVYCDGSVAHFDWLVAHGVSFGSTLYEQPTWMPPTEDGLMWLGENAWPFTEIAAPAPRGHRGPVPMFAGKVLMDALVEAVGLSGAKARFDTKATALLVEDGRVVGLRARCFGTETEVRARRGVVITTGGFVDNEDMLAEHAPALLGRGKVSDGLDDGSGIAMAQQAGASTRRMHAHETALTYVPLLAARGMIVNALGQRFVNEDAYPGIVSHAAVVHQPAPYWVIVDEAGFEATPASDRWGVQPAFADDDLDALGAELGMPEGALRSTVEAYNRDAGRGRDSRHHKDPRWLRPLEPPFAAIDIGAGFARRDPGAEGGSAGVAGFTLGGLRTSVDGEVLDWSGAPIAGLYAAGRATSGIHGEGYISGTSLGDGTFFGRRAGRRAATTSTGDGT